ncbi:hypothetical protein HOB10_02510 [Candidatus Parcubacteria bacterium]|jgi:hypothetical protein|nr:hypothetical protein [Candidatus Parcubacteria bacterium]
MKLLEIISSTLFIAAIVLSFIDWKIAIWLWSSSIVIHSIPLGPDKLLGIITGVLILLGLVYIIFINWIPGLLLIIAGSIITRFRLYSRKLIIRYYKNNPKELNKIKEKNNK